MATPVVCPRQPLPKKLEVNVVLSRPSTEIGTDMTMLCVLSGDTPFPPNNGRVRFYSTIDAVEADFTPGGDTWYAANAFFSQAERPTTMCIGAVFKEPQPAGLLAGPIDLVKLRMVADGAFSIAVNGVPTEVTGLDFTTVQNTQAVAAIVQGALLDAGVAAGASVNYGSLFLSTALTGDGAELSYVDAPSTGIDVSALLGLTQAAGASLWVGYSPGGLSAEASLVSIAARCTGRPIYGWCLARPYRDTDDQVAFAEWAQAREVAIFVACTNSVTAYNTSDTTNIGYSGYAAGRTRQATFYHHDPRVYPDVAYLAQALATDYSAPNSAKTMKYKQLAGIEPSPMDETIAGALDSRRINYYVAMGNTSRITRQGVQSAESWWTDSLVNLDNLYEEILTGVFNVLLRNKKVAFTPTGQGLVISELSRVFQKYKDNDCLDDRPVYDAQLESGVRIEPAYSITPTPIYMASDSDRASRTLPPFNIVAYESGASHKININVSVFE